MQVSREQVRCLQGDEIWLPDEKDFNLLRSAEQDLEKKHSSAHDLRDAAPPLLPEQLPAEVPEGPLEPGSESADPPPEIAETEVSADVPLDPAGNPLGSEPTASLPLLLAPSSPRATPATWLPKVQRLRARGSRLQKPQARHLCLRLLTFHDKCQL